MAKGTKTKTKTTKPVKPEPKPEPILATSIPPMPKRPAESIGRRTLDLFRAYAAALVARANAAHEVIKGKPGRATTGPMDSVAEVAGAVLHWETWNAGLHVHGGRLSSTVSSAYALLPRKVRSAIDAARAGEGEPFAITVVEDSTGRPVPTITAAPAKVVRPAAK